MENCIFWMLWFMYAVYFACMQKVNKIYHRPLSDKVIKLFGENETGLFPLFLCIVQWIEQIVDICICSTVVYGHGFPECLTLPCFILFSLKLSQSGGDSKDWKQFYDKP